jgi:hypothetical protein
MLGWPVARMSMLLGLTVVRADPLDPDDQDEVVGRIDQELD